MKSLICFAFAVAALAASASENQVEQFRQQIHSAYSPAPGEFISRIAGQIETTNTRGEPLTIVFATSLHDWVETGDKTYSASPEELAFLTRNLFDAPKNCKPCDFLVEQGTRDAADHIWGVLGLEPRLPTKIKSEYDFIYDESTKRGWKTRNIDVAIHPDLPRHLISDKQIPTGIVVKILIERLCWTTGCKLETLTKWSEIAGSTEAIEFINSNRKLVEQDLSTLQKNPLADILGEYSPLTQMLRDEYMAARLLEARGTVLYSTHTAHMLGVLKFLKSKITRFDVREVEKSENLYEIWKDRTSSGRPKEDPSFY